MKFLIKLLLFLLAAILAGLLVAQPAIAEAPQSNSSIIDPPYGPYEFRAINPITKTANNGRNLAPSPVYAGKTYSQEEVQQLIKDYSKQYGISADLPLRVANCESGFNQSSKNSYSTASGVYQYIASTWRNTEAGKAGISPFDADANVRMAIKSIASGGISNWNASKSCWQ